MRITWGLNHRKNPQRFVWIWAESLETPSNYSIPKNVLESMEKLNEYGLTEEAKQIAEQF